MNEDIQLILAEAEESMQNSLEHLKNELAKIRAGRATPSMLESVMVDYYGSPTPLGQVGNISTLDPRTLTVQPWEKSMLNEIAKGILNANLGLNPQNNGEIIIIAIPVLTEERRKDLVKKAKAEGEHAKVGIRSRRKDSNDLIKSLKNEGLSEDLIKDGEDSVQKLTDKYIVKVDDLVAVKEVDILKV
jgi:ribosome recycling factor